MSEALTHLNGLDIPARYRTYYEGLLAKTEHAFAYAKQAKDTGKDASLTVDSKTAFDLSDRVSKILDVDVTDRLRELIDEKGRDLAALLIAGEIAKGKHLPEESTLKERVDLAVRVGLATVTEGVTIAPLQGISDITIKKNRDGTEYLSLSIAGPMRSAGGTESAVTMLIADHVRQIVGLAKYRADSFDDETGRFVEELRIYEREASNFQYRVTDEDIVKVISNLPVELDGVDTDPYEVINHKDMVRIKTSRVRGGALRVLNDGLIGRSKKLLRRVKDYNIEGWEWLAELEGATKMTDDDDAASTKRMREVIAGRSVLSTAGTLGGFRLRYGRACNTGFTAVGIHPAVAELLDHVVTAGTQVKTDIPGKGAIVAIVDSIDAPIVRLKNGDVVMIRDTAQAVSARPDLAEILHMGDILISFGDFVENDAKMPPSGYVEEYWAAELAEKLGHKEARKILDGGKPTLTAALELSRSCGVGLHPAYLYYWDQISTQGITSLLLPESHSAERTVYPANCKGVLEKLGVPHRNDNGLCVLEGDEAGVFDALLFTGTPAIGDDILGAISASSGISIRAKFSTSVGVRIGRPEKAAERKMKPPTHSLFPVENKGGMTRNILKTMTGDDFFATMSNRTCQSCNKPSISIKCNTCGGQTAISRRCSRCNLETDELRCAKCKRDTISFSYVRYPLKEALLLAQERTRVKVHDPFKGVNKLIGQGKAAEPLEKGLLRQHNNITMFKDGTVRYEATNAPLTHFKASWIGATVEQLLALGYETDMDGKPLVDENQLVELFTQDVIIPLGAAEHLVKVCRFVDAELKGLYGLDPYYQVTQIKDLVGQLIVGLAPHTSTGIITRVIGFAKTHVCFGTPNWHSAKRRDADGDADSLILLLDVFLNFSREFLSERIGGLMDVPLLLQPFVLPHEAQKQAHNLEVVRTFPREFFDLTASKPKASEVKCIETVKSRIGTSAQYSGYEFTHETSSLVSSHDRSAYSTLGSMAEKLDFQIRTADLINAVDTSELITNVIMTHLVPDLAGNLRAYARQDFRCTKCQTTYRRIPIARKCMTMVGAEPCNNKLIATITRPSVSKYLRMAMRLVDKYDVGPYLSNQIHGINTEIDMVFGKTADQMQLADYA